MTIKSLEQITVNSQSALPLPVETSGACNLHINFTGCIISTTPTHNTRAALTLSHCLTEWGNLKSYPIIYFNRGLRWAGSWETIHPFQDDRSSWLEQFITHLTWNTATSSIVSSSLLFSSPPPLHSRASHLIVIFFLDLPSIVSFSLRRLPGTIAVLSKKKKKARKERGGSEQWELFQLFFDSRVQCRSTTF